MSTTKEEITQLAERLRKMNDWRRGADRPQPNPDEAKVLEKKGKDNATS